jgi:hypothetical protein
MVRFSADCTSCSVLPKKGTTCRVGPGPIVCPDRYLQRGSSALVRWVLSGAPTAEDPRAEIGSRRGAPARARRPVLARRREAGLVRSRCTAVCLVITSGVVSRGATARLRKRHLPTKHANAEDEGAGRCCSPMPEQVCCRARRGTQSPRISWGRALARSAAARLAPPRAGGVARLTTPYPPKTRRQESSSPLNAFGVQANWDRGGTRYLAEARSSLGTPTCGVPRKDGPVGGCTCPSRGVRYLY